MKQQSNRRDFLHLGQTSAPNWRAGAAIPRWYRGAAIPQKKTQCPQSGRKWMVFVDFGEQKESKIKEKSNFTIVRWAEIIFFFLWIQRLKIFDGFKTNKENTFKVCVCVCVSAASEFRVCWLFWRCDAGGQFFWWPLQIKQELQGTFKLQGIWIQNGVSFLKKKDWIKRIKKRFCLLKESWNDSETKRPPGVK